MQRSANPVVRPLAKTLAIAAVTALASCASTGGAVRSPIGAAVIQPLDDLGFQRPPIAQALAEASAHTYAGAEADCSSMSDEIGRLSAVLGPDFDEAPAMAGDTVEGLAADAVRGVASLPYRGIVRRVTGADRRERGRLRAIAAGQARRGFLRGVLAVRCPGNRASLADTVPPSGR